MLIEAIGQLSPAIQQKISLTIVGDGSEKNSLEQQTKTLKLEDRIVFTGWIPQQETLNYYQKSDVFCFPSVREFGGAVVLEAMAGGLPCIVVNNGGIGEYVTEATGFKIEPISREHVIEELKQRIQQLVQDSNLRKCMSVQAIERAKEFTWATKAQQMVEMYHEMIGSYRKAAEAQAAYK